MKLNWASFNSLTLNPRYFLWNLQGAELPFHLVFFPVADPGKDSSAPMLFPRLALRRAPQTSGPGRAPTCPMAEVRQAQVKLEASH